MISDIEFYRTLILIRLFEETILDNFSKGLFFGTTHTYLGQEANAVGVLTNLQKQDLVFSNHRCHGHFLAYGGDLRALFAELMGRNTGVCGGKGGSQHLHWRNFYSNGILGGTVPIAVGSALAEKRKETQAVAIAFLGDGALGEGVVYESLNIASLWNAPILFVVENNRIAQTTPIETAVAGSISGRFQAFDIPYSELDTSDVKIIYHESGKLIDNIRKKKQPKALILHTHRFGPHSKGDDTRPLESVEFIRKTRDPLTIHGERLNEKTREKLEIEMVTLVNNAFEAAQNDPVAYSGNGGLQ